MKPTRLMSPPGTYFITFSTWQRRRLFVVEPYAHLFLKTIYGYRRQGKFLLHAFVLMPEHVHLLLTPSETLERSVQLVKGGYSHAFGVEFGRWPTQVWFCLSGRGKIHSPRMMPNRKSFGLAGGPGLIFVCIAKIEGPVLRAVCEGRELRTFAQRGSTMPWRTTFRVLSLRRPRLSQ